MYLHRRRKRLEAQLAEELRLQQFEETPRTMTQYGFPPGGSNRNVGGLQAQQIQLIDQLITSPRPGNGQMQMMTHSPMGANGLLAPGGLLAMVPSTPAAAGPIRSPGGTAAAPPMYNKDIQGGERILGRQGERACDTVKSPGQSEAEVQARYETEMQQLYEIRTARREESRARQERMARRNAARVIGDYDTLRALQEEALVAASVCEQTGSIAMIRRYENRDKSTKIASVNYHGLGIVRHDGSKVKTEINSAANGSSDSGATKYDFPGESWVAETFGEMPGLSHQQATGTMSTGVTLAGPAASSSSSASSGHHSHDTVGACTKCPAPITVQDIPSATSAMLPRYSAISWGDAPPYSSPLFPRPQIALTKNSDSRIAVVDSQTRSSLAQRMSTSSTAAIKSPAQLPVPQGHASMLPTPTIAVTEGTPITGPGSFNAWSQLHTPMSAHTNMAHTPMQTPYVQSPMSTNPYQNQVQNQGQVSLYNTGLQPTNVWAQQLASRTPTPSTAGVGGVLSAQFEDAARGWYAAGAAGPSASNAAVQQQQQTSVLQNQAQAQAQQGLGQGQGLMAYNGQLHAM